MTGPTSAQLPPTQFDYDPFTPEVMANPLPYYEVLREHHPLYIIPNYDAIVLSRFQDVFDVLSDSDDIFLTTEGSVSTPERLLMHNDGPLPEPPHQPLGRHSIYASEVQGSVRVAHGRPLRPRPVAQLESTIRVLVRAKLDALLPRREFDLVDDFAGQVAAEVACTLVRLPLDAAPRVREAVNLATSTDPLVGGVDLARMEELITDLVRPVVQQRRASGADGSFPLVDGLLDYRLDGRPLSDDEIAMQYVGVVVGATETLPKVFAHGLMELAAAPGQLTEVRAGLPASAPVAFEEMLRYCGPAQWFMRTVRKPVSVLGHDLHPGQRVILLVQSANRDPREFDDPQQFRWNRSIPRTLAFGRGPHMCIGLHLARLEGRILLEEWLQAVSAYRVHADRAVRQPSSFQWGWTSMPVSIEVA